ncbi:TPA: RluA family pseudouridine synthase [Candidatus Collierbacteria bacterium]|uniref:Pseudouridine synthase RsuA/RluA-like domain-containing protein n=2 Tax=Candidatus Collieribacteriota TaxID=1752725 RepID=A0A1F5FYR5_9BACT|nr:MAG: Pseudouridine synthase [Microgenomates group bacterium GW2011_GWF1_46_12]KKU27690.1 MAG: Pseudouridine synthase [Microgenomates group bacterium GW2011_GWF2_46_18]KKU43355.1 MAG: Pseudouridine synthase [Microgenomates group bacterium GW2011_GWA1_46_7]KKU44843.1 MAG: Pseudouridine synthase [Microgenomates group bacterium GW2011_GWB1_46_7]KKU60611.1 MAG: Pseudouridine synthase [Microgenomates group bacterium GW2011_GWE1_47_12]KKU62193.1 MAG: Pseudouridine synthase [Microgenomates group ba
MDIPILYEDENIVVIDKPSGVVSNKAETVKTETVQDWMQLTARVDPSQIQGINPSMEYFRERSGLVHRLDKETSGVMVLAKTVGAFVELLRQFKEREVKKTYLALTHGIWQVNSGEISLPIGRRRDDRKRMGVVEDGRESVTGYRVLASYREWQFPKELKVDTRGYTGFSTVEFAPKTGRMHQIRVHARHVGHPVVGDEQYAGRKRSREDRKWASHVMLQAQTLELTHPVTKQRMKWESQGEDLAKVLAYLS